MKLQYHKIRGVDKSVCTAEQKIAYNMASRIYGDIRFAKAWQQYDSGKVPAFLQNDLESKAIRTYFTTWQRDYNKASAHYNEDAIFSALRDGLEVLTQCSTMREAKAETKPLTLQSATTLAAPPIAPTIPITKTNTVSCSATKTCAAYKPVPQSPAKP